MAGLFRYGGAGGIRGSASGLLYHDADGSGAGAQILIAELGAGTALTAQDIVLIWGPGPSGPLLRCKSRRGGARWGLFGSGPDQAISRKSAATSAGWVVVPIRAICTAAALPLPSRS